MINDAKQYCSVCGQPFVLTEESRTLMYKLARKSHFGRSNGLMACPCRNGPIIEVRVVLAEIPSDLFNHQLDTQIVRLIDLDAVNAFQKLDTEFYQTTNKTIEEVSHVHPFPPMDEDKTYKNMMFLGLCSTLAVMVEQIGSGSTVGASVTPDGQLLVRVYFPVEELSFTQVYSLEEIAASRNADWYREVFVEKAIEVYNKFHKNTKKEI